MRHEKLINELVSFLKTEGTDAFAKLISTTLDFAGAHHKESIHLTREKVVNKLKFWNELALTER